AISNPKQASSWDVGDVMAVTWGTRSIAGNVRISISRNGGKNYQGITTENDGVYDWAVTGPASVNCMLKIEPVDDATKGTTQGLFSIVDPTDGLVAYYPFAGSAGDMSGSGHDGTAAGAAPGEDRFGNAGYAYGFDGQDDEISIPDHADLQLTGAMTLSAWIKREGTWDQSGRIVCKRSDVSGDGYGMEVAHPSGKLRFHLHMNDSFSSTAAIPMDEWTHVAVTFDSAASKVRLYINGELDSEHST
ncbi:unnamed protein product, partial [marine sediment metagenome]